MTSKREHDMPQPLRVLRDALERGGMNERVEADILARAKAQLQKEAAEDPVRVAATALGDIDRQRNAALLLRAAVPVVATCAVLLGIGLVAVWITTSGTAALERAATITHWTLVAAVALRVVIRASSKIGKVRGARPSDHRPSRRSRRPPTRRGRTQSRRRTLS